jgi:hypothetical protein
LKVIIGHTLNMRKAQLPDKSEVKVRHQNGKEQWGIEPAWVEFDQDDLRFKVTFNADGTVRALQIETTNSARTPITATMLRSVNSGAIEATARRFLDERIGAFADAVLSETPFLAKQWLDASSRMTEAHLQSLARVARAYADTVGQPGWLATIAEEQGLSMGTVTKMVKDARIAGLLTPTTRGKAGGSLTLQGAQILGLVRQWEDHSPEIQQAAIELKRRQEPLDRALRAGEITDAEYREAFGRLRSIPTEVLLAQS